MREIPINSIARRIPRDVMDALTPAQQQALIDSIAPRVGPHGIDLRVSIPLFQRRFYVTLLAGRERRGLDRLAREGQLDTHKVLAVYAAVAGTLLFPILVILAASAVLSRLAGLDTLEPPLLALHELFRRP